MIEGRIIELNAEWELLESPEPPRRRARMRLRGIVTVVVTGLCLATMDAAARPPVPALELLGLVKRPSSGAPLQNTEMRLTGGMLLAQTAGRLVAMDPDGRVRWTAHFATGQDSYLDYWMWQGNLLVEQYEVVLFANGEYAGMPKTTSIALDPATGIARWRGDGSVRPAGDVIIVDDGVHPKQIHRSLTSDPLWTMPAVHTWEVDVEHNMIYSVSSDGTYTEYDLHSGAVRASGKVDVPPIDDGQTSPAGGYPDQWGLQVFEDRIVLQAVRVGEFGAPEPETRVYDRLTMRQIPTPQDQYDAVFDCGPVLCTIRGEQVSVVDKEELVELWRPQLGAYPYWTGSYLMLPSGSGVEAFTVVDPRTGRELLRLEGWQPVGERTWPTDGKQLWLTRFTPPHYTRVALLGETGPRVIGSIPFQLTGCELEGNLLACALADGRVGVWRINAS